MPIPPEPRRAESANRATRSGSPARSGLGGTTPSLRRAVGVLPRDRQPDPVPKVPPPAPSHRAPVTCGEDVRPPCDLSPVVRRWRSTVGVTNRTVPMEPQLPGHSAPETHTYRLPQPATAPGHPGGHSPGTRAKADEEAAAVLERSALRPHRGDRYSPTKDPGMNVPPTSVCTPTVTSAIFQGDRLTFPGGQPATVIRAGTPTASDGETRAPG
ncbi:hypothetical protein FRACA_2800002 [Frankia canadensis]|uniref:Uncharacterized protein n=1 Tax=Frankia canadensis TaxID=1836972 RepID=A0A2I2KT27_9ACTN|nr:hypothetical protein FRACA_2800002 [Frankia canadensis]SOU56111.1 hypothetical protein FRACA_2800002 [Frankia canadensis]